MLVEMDTHIVMLEIRRGTTSNHSHTDAPKLPYISSAGTCIINVTLTTAPQLHIMIMGLKGSPARPTGRAGLGPRQ